MRDIKFRAWDSKDNRMVDVNILHFPETGLPYPLWNDDEDKQYAIIGRYKVMQFTGLKDKNGEEIYEGDIIKYSDKHNIMNTGTYEVGWDNEQAGYGLRGINTLWGSPGGLMAMPPDDEGEFSATCAGEVLSLSTCLGNRYENPELLKVMK